MSATHTDRMVVWMCEYPFGVSFFRVAAGAGGVPGGTQYYDAAAGVWVNEWDESACVVAMTPVHARENFQGFAIPRDVIDDEHAQAAVHVLKRDGTIASDIGVMSVADLRSHTAGPWARP